MKALITFCIVILLNQTVARSEGHGGDTISQSAREEVPGTKTALGGAKFSQIDTAILGPTWKAPDGVMWGDIILGADAYAKEVSFASAVDYCKKLGAELPSIEDYKRLAEFLGATPEVVAGKSTYSSFGYLPEIIPSLITSQDGKAQTLHTWSSTISTAPHEALGFSGIDGQIVSAPKESKMYFRCILRDKPKTQTPERTKKSKNGSRFTQVNNAGLGEAWKAPDGIVWGDVILGKDQTPLELSFTDAINHCKKIGAELPSIDDFKRLGEFLGATPDVVLGDSRYNPKGYIPEILPNLTTKRNGKILGTDVWSSTGSARASIATGFGGLDGEIVYAKKESKMPFRCIRREKPEKKEESKAPSAKAPVQPAPVKQSTQQPKPATTTPKPVELRKVDGIRKPFLIMGVLEDRYRTGLPSGNKSLLQTIRTLTDGTAIESNDSEFQDAILEDFRTTIRIVGGWYERKEAYNSLRDETARKAFFLKLKAMNEKPYRDEAEAIKDVRETLAAVRAIDEVLYKMAVHRLLRPSVKGLLEQDEISLTVLIIKLVKSAVSR